MGWLALLGQQDVLNASGKAADDAARLLAILIGVATFVVVVIIVLVLAVAIRSARERRRSPETPVADHSRSVAEQVASTRPSTESSSEATDPAPAESPPTDPAPTDPEATEPAGVERAPTDPEASEPVRTTPPATVGPHPKERAGVGLVVFAGLIFPIVVLSGVFAFTIGPLNRFTHHPDDALEITVIGHRWWWEVEYNGEQFRTANELHIPVDTDVLLRLESDDVIHSFWVPELSGKIDMVPGKTNNLTLHATRIGEFTGKCAEFCGIQHARMRFDVIVEGKDDYADWVERMQTTPPEPTGEELRGRQIFLGSACVYCHAVEGTNATSRLGPDLTHVASRRMLAAGTTPNTRGALAGWILDPQSMKPGNLMPPMDIPGDQLQQLLAYLESLE